MNNLTDKYQDLDLCPVLPHSDVINESLGLKDACPFMQVVEANIADSQRNTPINVRQLTEEQKMFYWNAYHEGYQQAQRDLNHIVNP